MTSLRQIESNRRNALKSTGPKTGPGKQRASKNAVRHGLTAETVVKLLEDPDDYRAFEMSVTADYDPETAVDRELVLRLASLLWRLRRATSIETGLFQIEFEVPSRAQQPLQAESPETCEVIAIFQSAESEADGLEMVRRFLRLTELDNGAFDRLGRYQAALWRQARQTIFTLEGLRWAASISRHARSQGRWRNDRSAVREHRADWAQD